MIFKNISIEFIETFRFHEMLKLFELYKKISLQIFFVQTIIGNKNSSSDLHKLEYWKYPLFTKKNNIFSAFNFNS